jgi:hypothetical protein
LEKYSLTNREQTAGLTLEEIGAKFGDHVAVEISAIDVDQIEFEKTGDKQVESVDA